MLLEDLQGNATINNIVKVNIAELNMKQLKSP